MREKRLITIAGTMVLLLLSIIYIAYSVFSAKISIDNLNVSTYAGNRPTFTSSGEASLSLQVDSSNMVIDDAESLVDEADTTLNVSLSAGTEADTCCDFDINLNMDATVDSVDGLKLSVYNASISETNLLETTAVNLDKNTTSKTIYSGKICSSATSGITSKTYAINAAFYNLNQNQDALYGADIQKLSVKVENVKCGVDRSATTVLLKNAKNEANVVDGESALVDYGDKGSRYVGSNPSNYIYFNCDDYAHQSDSTCEKWRIISIEDGSYYGVNDASLVKIVRDEAAASNRYYKKGKNNWSASDVMSALNSEVEINGVSTTTMGYYYNRTSGIYYGSTTIDFSSTGLKSSSRDLIQKVTINVRNFDASDSTLTASEVYNLERNTGVDYGTWSGKILLPYIYDYYYATSGSSDVPRTNCLTTYTQYIDETFVTDCSTNNWINGETLDLSNLSWAISGSSKNSTHANMYGFGAGAGSGGLLLKIRPAVYLDKNAKIKAGDGTIEYPYQLKVD